MWELACIFIICWFFVPTLLRATVLKPARCESKRQLNGMVAIVTGANTGLGKETALDFVKRGAKVYMACRNLEKAHKAREDILNQVTDANLVIIKLDLSSLKSVRDCCEEFLKKENQLDIIVANAGFGSLEHRLTEDDIEWHLACNHLGHFLLIRTLMPLLLKSGASDQKSRIVLLSSRAHKIFVKCIDYEGLHRGDYMARSTAYGQSKLANLLCMRYLNKLVVDMNVTVNSVHPGMCKTEFFRYYIDLPAAVINVLNVVLFPLSYLCLTASEGAQTAIYAAVDDDMEGITGKYLVDCSTAEPSKLAQDDEEAEKLWRWSCSKTKLPLDI